MPISCPRHSEHSEQPLIIQVVSRRVSAWHSSSSLSTAQRMPQSELVNLASRA